MNQVILTGRVGKDAEVRSFDNGGKIASFSLATSERWKDKNGEKKERTDWHNVVIGLPSLVTVVGDWVKKGSHLLVSGMIRYREYEKEGVKKTITEIHADRIEFLGVKEKKEEAPVEPVQVSDDGLPF